MPDEPAIDPAITEAPKALQVCPQCSARKYHVELDMQGEVVKCVAIECEVCGFDILEAYQAITRRKRR
jgi:hypothetical protein